MIALLILLHSGVLVKTKNNNRFNQNNQFRILHLTDLHFGEGESDDHNVDGLYSILRYTRPDLTIITGDLVSGYRYQGGDHFFQDCHKKFVKPFQELNLSYMFTLGNHDDEANMDRMEIMTFDAQHENSYSMTVPFYGTNYYVPIFNSNDTEEILRVWAFDTNNFGCGGWSGSWGCLIQDVVNNFKQLPDGPRYGIAAMHIPPPEFMELYNTQPIFGQAEEEISCPRINTGIIDAILEKKTIQFAIVGHDHMNDFGGEWPTQNSNLTLMYGRKSGYGGYEVCCGRHNGGRIIDYQQIGGELIVNHFIVDYNNQTFHQNFTLKSIITDSDECALDRGPTPFYIYGRVGLLLGVYLLVHLLILSLSFLKHHVKIFQQDIDSMNYEPPNFND